MYFVYVIKSESLNKTYIGQTANLNTRLKEHQGRLNAFDWTLVHVEEYRERSLAVRRERYFKTGDGRKVLRNKGIE